MEGFELQRIKHKDVFSLDVLNWVELNLVNLLLFKWVGTGRGWGAVVLDKYTNSR